MNTNLTFALSKKAETALIHLFRVGYPLPDDLSAYRHYRLSLNDLTFLLVRAEDIPYLVEHGAADLGVVGKTILTNQNRKLIEWMELGTDRLVANRSSYVLKHKKMEQVRNYLSKSLHNASK